jgi:hypothetical protein
LAIRVHLNKKNINLLKNKQKYLFFLLKKTKKEKEKPEARSGWGARPPPVAEGGWATPCYFFVLFF